MMNTEGILKDFEGKNFSKVYFLKGEEEILKDEFLYELKRKVAYPEFNWNLYYGDEIDFDTVAHSLFSLSFMSEFKLVVIKKAGSLNLSFLTQIAKNIERIPSSNSLLLSGSSLSLEKQITKIGKIILFKKPTFQEMTAYVKKKCREEKKDIDNLAISVIIENTGRELSILVQELEKIITYVGSKEKIEPEDVLKVITHSRTYTVFQLVDAISEKRVEESLKILKNLLVFRITPQQIIGLLNWQFERIWKVKSRIYSGISSYRALQEVGIPSWSAKNFISQLNKLSWETLRRYFNLLLDVDFQIKRGAQESLTLELFLLRITK